MFGLLTTVIIGFIVGVIAKLIMPGKENMGLIMTTLLGIAGSLVATLCRPSRRLVQRRRGRRLDRFDRRRLSLAVDLPEGQVPRNSCMSVSVLLLSI